MIYLDYNATTPLDAAIREVMVRSWEEGWANPSSIHAAGRQARALLDDARDRVAVVLGSKPGEIIFTSGGTEANNLAVLGTARRLRDRGRHLICSAIEHHAVLHAHQLLARSEGYQLTLLPVDDQGRVNPGDVVGALRPDTVLVSVMAANNETGILQPIGAISRICRERGVLFHCDAVQWLGKEPFLGPLSELGDLVTLCAHKIHGPKGIGLLYARSAAQPSPLLVGGAQELERRAGTENLAAILGLTEAVERFLRPPVFDRHRLGAWTERLAQALGRVEGVTPLLGAPRLANTLAFTVEGADSISLLAALDLAGIGASSGSACAVGSLEPSHVVLAMGRGREAASSLVRFSLGRETTEEEVVQVETAVPDVVAQVRGRGSGV